MSAERIHHRSLLRVRFAASGDDIAEPFHIVMMPAAPRVGDVLVVNGIGTRKVSGVIWQIGYEAGPDFIHGEADDVVVSHVAWSDDGDELRRLLDAGHQMAARAGKIFTASFENAEPYRLNSPHPMSGYPGGVVKPDGFHNVGEKPLPYEGAAIMPGYSGDPCSNCHTMMLRRAGTCMVCDACGATTGCS